MSGRSPVSPVSPALQMGETPLAWSEGTGVSGESTLAPPTGISGQHDSGLLKRIGREDTAGTPPGGGVNLMPHLLGRDQLVGTPMVGMPQEKPWYQEGVAEDGTCLDESVAGHASAATETRRAPQSSSEPLSPPLPEAWLSAPAANPTSAPGSSLEGMLSQGKDAVQGGDKAAAWSLLTRLIRADPRNEAAWLLLSDVVDAPEDQQICLENVLVLNPHNERAAAGVTHLSTQTGIPPRAPIEPLDPI